MYRHPLTLHFPDTNITYDQVEYYLSMGATSISRQILYAGDESLPLLLTPLLLYYPLLLFGLWGLLSRVETPPVPWVIAGLLSLVPVPLYCSAMAMVYMTTFDPVVFSPDELDSSAFSVEWFAQLLAAPDCRLMMTFYYYPSDRGEGSLHQLVAAEEFEVMCIPAAAAAAAAAALLLVMLACGLCAIVEKKSCS